MEVPQTAMAFANRGKEVPMTFFPGWTKEEFDGPCREWARAMYEKTKAHRLRNMEGVKFDENTQSSVGQYINHDGMYICFYFLHGDELMFLQGLGMDRRLLMGLILRG